MNIDFLLIDRSNLRIFSNIFFIFSVGIFGYCWQIGDTTVNSQYIYRSPEHVQGTLGIRIALRKVNVTLTGKIFECTWSL